MELRADRNIRVAKLVILAVWVLALIGYFAPWVGRAPAALAWNAYDLFDLLRLLPEIETGALSVNLQALRLPLVGLAVLLPLSLADTRWPWRLGAALVGVGLALATLPPYPQIVNAWRTPGWRIPFWWGVGGMVATAGITWFAPYLGRYRPWLALGWVAVTGIPAVATMQRLLPALCALHATQVNPGWGFWLCILSFGVSALVLWLQGIGESNKKERY